MPGSLIYQFFFNKPSSFNHEKKGSVSDPESQKTFFCVENYMHLWCFFLHLVPETVITLIMFKSTRPQAIMFHDSAAESEFFSVRGCHRQNLWGKSKQTRNSLLKILHAEQLNEWKPVCWRSLIEKNGPRQANLVIIAYASSEGSGEPAHPRSLARTFAARSYKQWVKRNLQTESQIPGPSEWLGMRS